MSLIEFDRPLLPLEPAPGEALDTIKSPDGKEIYASGDDLYREAFFGRDSLRAASDLLETDPELCKNLILRNASLIGYRFDWQSEEEYGRIAHEHREPDKGSRRIFDELAAKWGTSDGNMTYYGSVDATPEFIRLVGRYTELYGSGILSETVSTRQNGDVKTVSETVDMAIGWLRSKLEVSSSGLLEYRRTNPEGIDNQVWKDSKEAYVHENGDVANHKRPIASIEVQGIAYDALMAAAWMKPDMRLKLLEEAHNLRDTAIDLLWMPDKNYFALGVDHDPKDDSLRQIKTKMANAASLLDSGFFDDLPSAERQKYLTAIVDTIMSPDFLTDVGIRSRALSMNYLKECRDSKGRIHKLGYDYHGYRSSWPKETNEIAKGLDRQGFTWLSVQLWNRMLNAVQRLGYYPEFFYVDDRGKVVTDIVHARQVAGLAPEFTEDMINIESKQKPETLQAWTITAVIHALQRIYRDKAWDNQPQTDWRIEKTWRILENITLFSHYHKSEELHRFYPKLLGSLAV